MSSPQFLRETLEANLQFQTKVREELQHIAKRKAENRRQAARLLQHVVARWDQPPHDGTTPVAPNADSSSNNNNKDSKWKYDPYRRWTRRYFVDPQGSVPPPNPDIIRRRQLEQQQHALCHTNASPWSAKETKALQGIVLKLMTKQKSTTATDDNDDDSSSSSDDGITWEEIDFNQVATQLRAATRKDRKSLLVPRSAEECRLQYQYSQAVVPFTKQESLSILEQVHADDHKKPIWSIVAASLAPKPSEQPQQQPHPTRTAWQCLCHYQTKLASTPSEASWTLPEDELLLWYLAAMGPQFLLDNRSAAHLSSRLLPNKAPKQILSRANQTLLNPNLRHRDIWNDEDQRKLVLCMKIYSDSTSTSALTRAAAHFPNRAAKSVAEKWNRSLNPEFTARPFTPQEDAALLEAVRSNTSWSDIARQLPRFQIQRLYRRWEFLATDDDLAKYGKDAMKRKEGAKRGLVGSGDDALLNPDDFVLQVVKKTNKKAKR